MKCDGRGGALGGAVGKGFTKTIMFKTRMVGGRSLRDRCEGGAWQQTGCGRLPNPPETKPCFLNYVCFGGRGGNPWNICVSSQQTVFRVICILKYSLKGKETSFRNPSRASNEVTCSMRVVTSSEVLCWFYRFINTFSAFQVKRGERSGKDQYFKIGSNKISQRVGTFISFGNLLYMSLFTC